jgi:cytoskeleton protein RodZ
MNNQKELIPMQPGDLLRYSREQAGLTLERAAELSKIRPSVLAAIERGETADIPSVYLRGFIRNYARALGLDESDIEQQMEHVQGLEPQVQSVFSVKSSRGRSEKWIKASSYIAASAVIAALAWQFTHEAVRFSQGDSQLTAGSVSATALPEPVNGKATAPAANTHLNASIASVEVLQQRGERGGKAAAEEAWEAIGDVSDPAAAAAEPGAGPNEHRLTVRTSADSWVEIFDGQGVQLELDLLRAGNERAYSGTWPFRVMLGRASAVELMLDGESVDLAPYTRGNVARLTLGGETAPDGSEATPDGSESADSDRP